ncbi:type VII toxin-antitoxin system HepT family RNase toxin [Priestia megaterium]|uniref:type VII toxin-antitoxin system HepT family RNase toxin n=1 Tax=Priestia megaterium TaxID=1404 RepID=UPI00301D33B9
MIFRREKNVRNLFLSKKIKFAAIITSEIAYRMKAMLGFRNIAVHDYQAINQDILQQILEKHLSDFTTYTKQILDY